MGDSIIDRRLLRWDFVVVPGSIERIAPFPPLAAQLLERIPSIQGEERDWFALLEPEPELLADIARVAIRSELATAGEDASPEMILARVKSADLARTAVTIV